jgi:putative radical SAM enzyme (TIGR03279 family)
MKKNGLLIASLDQDLARKTGLEPGDRIVHVDGQPVEDELDYRFHTAEDRVELEVHGLHAKSPRLVTLTDDEPRGICFQPMRTRRCRNKCLFCFVDQLPPGLRKTLYVKDEDYRFSFLYGNFVTLSSIRDEELDRIRRIRMSPIYVSVHATDPDVRDRLLGRKKSRDILKILGKLTDWGITVHAQVVLCPGINDGKVLEKTISDLAGFHPGLASIAVVPVGLTRFRRQNRLTPLRGVGKSDAERIINKIEELKENWKDVYKGSFLFLADEFYWKAERSFPSIREYGDLPQIENGVGMVPLFYAQWEESRKGRPGAVSRAGSASFLVVTGELAYPHVRAYARWLEVAKGVRLNVVPVRNDTLGGQVNVTGLLMGRDLLKQFEKRVSGHEMLLVPDVMLDIKNVRFLDDISLKDLERILGIPVAAFRPDPEDFEEILERYAPTGRRKRNKIDPMVD